MNISEHFTSREFDCHTGELYPPEWIADRLAPLCRVLERVRAELGGASCRVLSGYRSSAHNEALRAKSSGVAKNSQHVQGRAADATFSGHAPAEVHAVALRLYEAGELPDLGGLGIYTAWVHLDVRPRNGGPLARWVGAGVGSEPT